MRQKVLRQVSIGTKIIETVFYWDKKFWEKIQRVKMGLELFSFEKIFLNLRQNVIETECH